MPSFDVVSEINEHELTNAVDQANRELNQRFDFKDSGSVFELEKFVVKMKAPAEFQLKQMLDILRLRVAKRGIDPNCLDPQDPLSNLAEARQEIVMKHGIDAELGRKIQKLVKESKLKVQAGIQGDKVRVTGKSRDDLQTAMALLRGGGLDLPLQFENFRD
jgi:cyclic-di-GMP-binding protein